MSRLSIAARLYALIAFFALALLVVGGVSLMAERNTLRSERVTQLTALVQAASTIADRYREVFEKGLMTEADAKAATLSAIGAMRYGKGDYVFVMDEKGTMIQHPSPKMVGRDFMTLKDANGFVFTADVFPRALRDGGALVEYHWTRAGEDTPVEKLSYYQFNKPWGLMIATGVYIDDLRAAFWAKAMRLGIEIAVIVAFLVVAAMLVARSITRQLTGLGRSMRALAAGELDVAIEQTSRRDEIGTMAQDLAVLRDGLAERARLSEGQRADHEGRARRAEQLDVLMNAFETDMSGLSSKLNQASGAMEGMANGMTSAIAVSTSSSKSAVEAAEKTSANVQTVASATEELAASIREIASQVVRSSEIAGRAAEEARRTDGIVKSLAGTANRIGNVIAVINSIASQTNLLALNATIEAARAGEAGRGFAVVATEVKELAGQTAKATEEVATQIAAIQGETHKAVSAIEGIGRIIVEVDSIATSIAAAMEEQGSATEEIARNVQEAAQGTFAVSNAMADMRQRADEAAHSANQVLDTAGGVSRVSDAIASAVQNFLGEVKAA